MKKGILLIAFILISALSQSQTIGLTQHDSGSMDDGYVLFAPNTSTTTYLIDKCGKQIKTWPSNYRTGQSVYLLPDGTLLRTGNVNNSTFTAGGTGGIVQKIDWNGNVIWSYTVSDAIKCQHHDVKQLPNGNILIIAWESKTNTEAIAAGRNPSQVPATLWSEQIIEVQPIGSNGGTIVWEWHLWDHLVQNYDSTKSNFNPSIANNPQFVNINFQASVTNSDWIHINAIDYNPALDQILLSSHNFDEVWIIDHSTTTAQAATHLGGNSGKGGDLLYRWGNPQAYDSGTNTTQKLYGQHNARWIEEGLPYQNQIMIFNNGIGRPGGNYSTVEIINPPVDGFNYTTTLPYLPTTTSWNYNYGNPNSLYSQNISGAQPLSNGNVLVCSGTNGVFTETTSSGTQVWKYINPVNASGIITQNTTPTQNSVFRCSFYPSNFIGFVGHSLSTGNTIENTNSISNNCNLTLATTDVSFNEIQVYPNPAADFVAIQIPMATSDFKIDLIDELGRIIQSKTLLQGSTSCLFEIDTVYNGIYFVRINNNNEVRTFKLIIDK